MAIQLSHHSVTLLVTRTQVVHHIMSRKSVKQENSVTIWAGVTICCLCSPAGLSLLGPHSLWTLEPASALSSPEPALLSPVSNNIDTALCCPISAQLSIFTFTQLSDELIKTTMMVQLLYYEPKYILDYYE